MVANGTLLPLQLPAAARALGGGLLTCATILAAACPPAILALAAATRGAQQVKWHRHSFAPRA